MKTFLTPISAAVSASSYKGMRKTLVGLRPGCQLKPRSRNVVNTVRCCPRHEPRLVVRSVPADADQQRQRREPILDEIPVQWHERRYASQHPKFELYSSRLTTVRSAAGRRRRKPERFRHHGQATATATTAKRRPRPRAGLGQQRP